MSNNVTPSRFRCAAPQAFCSAPPRAKAAVVFVAAAGSSPVVSAARAVDHRSRSGKRGASSRRLRRRRTRRREFVPRAERPPPRRRRSRLARLVRASHDDFPRRAAAGGGLGRPAGGAPEGQGVAALRAQGGCRHRPRDDIRRRTPGCVPNLASRARRRPPRPPPPPAFPATRAEGLRHRRRPDPPSPPPRAPSRPRASRLTLPARPSFDLPRIHRALPPRRALRGVLAHALQPRRFRVQPRAPRPRRQRQARRHDRGLPPSPLRIFPQPRRRQDAGVSRPTVQDPRLQRRGGGDVRAPLPLHDGLRQARAARQPRRHQLLLPQARQGERRRAAERSARREMRQRPSLPLLRVRRRGGVRVGEGAPRPDARLPVRTPPLPSPVEKNLASAISDEKSHSRARISGFPDLVSSRLVWSRLASRLSARSRRSTAFSSV